MTNEFTIRFENPLKIQDIHMTVDADQEYVLNNHSETRVDIEPGMHTIRAVYSLDCGGNFMDLDKTIDVYIEKGCNYEAKVCQILKIFSLLKIYEDGTLSCC